MLKYTNLYFIPLTSLCKLMQYIGCYLFKENFMYQVPYNLKILLSTNNPKVEFKSEHCLTKSICSIKPLDFLCFALLRQQICCFMYKAFVALGKKETSYGHTMCSSLSKKLPRKTSS